VARTLANLKSRPWALSRFLFNLPFNTGFTPKTRPDNDLRLCRAPCLRVQLIDPVGIDTPAAFPHRRPLAGQSALRQ
jgi:hypothetical protein